MVADRPTFPGAASPPLLVGREREQTILRTRLAAALAGHGSLILIGGEAGIGKTMLAETLCREATDQGALVLVGRCYDVSEAPPYGPWWELFARYRPADGVPPLPPAFARRSVVADVTNQAALFNQVDHFLGIVSARKPVILVLDDLHWADPASLELLRVIGRGLHALPLLVLATYRVDAATNRHHLDHYLPAIIHEANAERLSLQPLDADAVRTLAAQRFCLPETDQRRLIAYLQERGEGNPFFIGELLRSLEEAGMLQNGGDGWALGDLRNVRVPPLVRQVIRGRLARFEDDEQRLLAIGAVIGQEVPLALWATAAERSEEWLLTVVEHAIEARLLEERANATRVRFVHALIRETLYEGLPFSQRRRWHQRVGELLATRSSPDPDAVAYHFRQAGDDRAVEWLVRAGDRARHVYALTIAANRYESALTILGESDTDPGERGWLLYRLTLVRRFAAPQQCIGYIDEATRIAGATENRPLMALTLQHGGILRIFCGDLGRGLADLVRSIEHIEALSGSDRVELAKADVGSLDLSAVRGLLTLNFAFAGRFSEALAVGEQIALQVGVRYGHGFGVAYTYAKRGRATEAERMFARTRADYRAQGHHFLHSLSAFMELRWVRLAYHADCIGERQELAAETEAALTRASDAGYHSSPRFAYAPLFLLEGRWDDARADARAAFTEGITGWRDNAIAMLGLLAYAQGDTKLAWSLIHDALPDGPQTLPGDWHFTTSIELQRLAAAMTIDSGHLDTAHAWLEAYDRWMAWSGDTLDQTEGQLLWAEYYRAARETERAMRHAQQALARASQPRQPLALLAAHRLLGELDSEAGRYEDAAMHLDESLALADACAAPYERALTLLAFAALHGAMKNIPAARHALDEARAICTPLGAKPALARADALAMQLAALVVPRPTYPNGLTAREVEVLRLIAQGRSNQEIADDLSMSVRTAERHISNIYGKVHAHGRAEATAYAFHRNLA